MCKYINIKARKGLKKYFAFIIKLVFFWMNLDKIYKKSEKIAQSWLNKKEKSKYVMNLNSVGSDGMKETYSINDFKNLENTVFESHLLSISSNYDQMLSKIYGDYMKLPPKSARITRHDLKNLKL